MAYSEFFFSGSSVDKLLMTFKESDMLLFLFSCSESNQDVLEISLGLQLHLGFV